MNTPLTSGGPISAADLRQYMAEAELEKLKLLEAKRARADAAAQEFSKHFMQDQMSQSEFQEVLIKVRHAVENGLLEVLVMRFPSKLCKDHGRAINNGEEDWPETLPGKAHELYERWVERGKPLGYHFKAMIIDFPDGMPGDVGLYLSWK